MDLQTLFDVDLLEKMIREGYVTRYPSEEGRVIYNYTAKSVYDNIWNDVNRKTRGLIVEETTGLLLARPFEKMMNYGQVKLPDFVHTKKPVVSTKADGSLIILHWWRGQWRTATRGRFDSEQSLLAAELLASYIDIKDPSVFPEGITLLFELIHPANKIVVDYKEARELVLLAAIDIETGADVPLWQIVDWPGERIEQFTVLESIQDVYLCATSGQFKDAEGLVACWEQYQAPSFRVKFKHPDYVQKHAMIFGTSTKTVWEALRTNKLDEVLDQVPDEIYAWIRTEAADLRGQYQAYLDQVNRTYKELSYLPSRKEFASKAKEYPFRAALFKLYDNQSIDELAWEQCKPVYRPFKRETDVG